MSRQNNGIINFIHSLINYLKNCEAGIYECLWMTEENGFKFAHLIVPFLENGLEDLVKDPSKFEKFSPANGCGSVDNLIEFVSKVLQACKEWPNAKIRTCK